MARNSAGQLLPRIPSEADGIQVNHCKNPTCKNFGVPAKPFVPRGRVSHGSTQADNYIVVARGKGLPCLKCHLCGEILPIKSNLGVVEELQRVGHSVWGSAPTCPDPNCPNHAIPLSAGLPHYKAFGRTLSGSQRYRCLACSRTITLSAPGQKQKKSHKNLDIFDRLMGKQPFARICDSLNITMSTLYGKVDFFYRQCLAFAGDRERRLLMEGPARDRLYLCVDRQDYISNWTQRSDRRNVQLTAIGSADLVSGYVMGMQLNYDPGLNPDDVEQSALMAGDYAVPVAFRRYARLWLKQDYAQAVARSTAKPKPMGGLVPGIERAYRAAAQRHDVESPEAPDSTRKLPGQGLQVRAEYALYGHFFHLARLTRKVEKVRFFLDQESGIRAAVLAAFQERVRRREVDAFYVRINKDLMVWEKLLALAESRKEFAAWQAAYPGLAQSQVETEMVKDAIRRAVAMGKWNDRWVRHPFPNMSEPEKAACYLTDFGDYTEDHLARLYLKASLHAIDRFFMQVRRRLSLLERPIGSSSNAGRTWYGYSAYNPASIEKMLGIFRVYYNYCLKGKDGKTPAMRLGLARGPVEVEKILAFDPYTSLRREPPMAKHTQPPSAGSPKEWMRNSEDVVI